MKGLTAKQEKFIDEYLKTPDDKSDSAKRAGFKHPEVTANKLLRTDKIIKAIKEKQSRISEAEGVTADWLAKYYKAIIETPITNICDWDKVNGLSTRPSSQIDQMSAFAIKEASEGRSREGEDRKVFLKMESKLEAMSALRSMLGIDAPKRQEVKATTETYNMTGTNEEIANSLIGTLESLITKSDYTGENFGITSSGSTENRKAN